MAIGPLLWPCARCMHALTSCQASSVVMATCFSVKTKPRLPLSPSSSSMASSLQVGVEQAQQGSWNARLLPLNWGKPWSLASCGCAPRKDL